MSVPVLRIHPLALSLTPIPIIRTINHLSPSATLFFKEKIRVVYPLPRGSREAGNSSFKQSISFPHCIFLAKPFLENKFHKLLLMTIFLEIIVALIRAFGVMSR